MPNGNEGTVSKGEMLTKVTSVKKINLALRMRKECFVSVTAKWSGEK